MGGSQGRTLGINSQSEAARQLLSTILGTDRQSKDCAFMSAVGDTLVRARCCQHLLYMSK